MSERGVADSLAWSGLPPGTVIMSLALLLLREMFEMICGLEKLLTGLIDRDPLGNGPNLLCLPTIFGSFREALDGHDRPLHVSRHQPGPFDLD
jgi:hypothetical protein